MNLKEWISHELEKRKYEPDKIPWSEPSEVQKVIPVDLKLFVLAFNELGKLGFGENNKRWVNWATPLPTAQQLINNIQQQKDHIFMYTKTSRIGRTLQVWNIHEFSSIFMNKETLEHMTTTPTIKTILSLMVEENNNLEKGEVRVVRH